MPGKKFMISGFVATRPAEVKKYFGKFGELVDFFFKQNGQFGFLEYVQLSVYDQMKLLGKHSINGAEGNVRRRTDDKVCDILHSSVQ